MMMFMADLAPVVQGTNAPVEIPKVPMAVFVVIFVVVLVAFLIWYIINRRNGD